MKSILCCARFLFLCTTLAACASVPDANGILKQSAQSASPPEIIGAKGPLTAEQSAALLKNIGVIGTMRDHLAIEQAVAKTRLVAGNSTRVLRDGSQTFRAMFAAIKQAKSYVNLEYYIFEDIESDGVTLGNLLIRKRRQGVAVNIIYDSYGSDTTPIAFFDRLKKTGVKLVQFNPVNPLEAQGGYAPNDRDHRKILVADGSTAIVGGVNLSTTYQPESPGKSSGAPGLSAAFWRDTDLEIKGPAVADLEDVFIEHWVGQKGPPLNRKSYFPKRASRGTEIIRVIRSTPDVSIPNYYVMLLSAIRHAQKKVWLMSAYFVPTDQEVNDLKTAARRGVDVRILVPNQSDSDMALLLQHSHYHELLDAGVKIYESRNEILHSKVLVVDGVWSVIGSSNFDYRSIVFNDEVDVVVLGQNTGQELEKMFEGDFYGAMRIDKRKWNDRPFIQKLKETFEPIWLTTVTPYL
jgi:cardiolipin synthase